MGAYLSEPKTEKLSADEEGDRVICGSSSMQGWRITQEDAHNCKLDFDTNTALFAVYDGHGGHEVAQYCSDHLPQYLQECDAYKSGDYTQALKDAFLGFDATLATPEVVAILKKIVSSKDGKVEIKSEGDDDDDEEDEEENVQNLYAEAEMPLEDVIAKYQNDLVNPHLKKLVKEDGKKPVSPFLRGRRTCTASCSSNSGNSEAEVSSSSSHDPPKPEESALPDSSGDIKKANSKDPDKVDIKSSGINGDVNASGDDALVDKCEGSGENVTSSSSPQENGDVLGKGKSKAKSSSEADSVDEAQTVLRRKTAMALFHSLLGQGDSDSDDDDEGDESFQGSEDSSEDDDEEGENQEEGKVEGKGDDDEEEESDDEEDDDDEEEDDDEDDDFTMKTTEEPGADSGCTAVVALLKDWELYVANAGDSRCVVSRKGTAIEMSLDHKPEDDCEKDRIVKAGGKVTVDGRVNGGLNLSRALGDHVYKQSEGLPAQEQMITALPDVRTLMIDPVDDEFMVLACDGIWNFMSSQDVVNFVRVRIQEGQSKLSQICEELFDHCLAPNTMGDGTGCDNMTAVIVQFRTASGNGDGRKRTVSPSESPVETSKRPKTEDQVSASV